jgi:DNA-binding transcriptional regulator GbsR (MarR family)
MSNIVKPLDAETSRFINEFASLYAPWGMPPAVARIYAYLLLSEEAASLDDIAEALDMAKSSVSVAARALEWAGLTRRYGERGSKRVRYAAAEDAAGWLAAKAAHLGTVGEMLQKKARTRLPATVRKRLANQASFYLEMRDSIDSRLRELKAGTLETKT